MRKRFELMQLCTGTGEKMPRFELPNREFAKMAQQALAGVVHWEDSVKLTQVESSAQQTFSLRPP